MIKDILEKYGKIDILINNAGISQTKLFTDITDEDWGKHDKCKFKFSFLYNKRSNKKHDIE